MRTRNRSSGQALEADREQQGDIRIIIVLSQKWNEWFMNSIVRQGEPAVKAKRFGRRVIPASRQQTWGIVLREVA